MNQDDPASQIGSADLSDLINAHSFPRYCEGRTGSILYSERLIPSTDTGFTCSKVGDIIYRISGPSFMTINPTYRYFMWSDGDRDEIVQIISADQVRARDSVDKEQQTGYVTGSGFGDEFYRKTKENIFHFDKRYFYSNWHIADYSQIYPISVEDPDESETKFFEVEDNMLGINPHGIFKIPMDATSRYFYKMNSPGPIVRITDVTKTDTLQIGRRYVYGMARLVNGAYHGDRAGVKNNPHVPTLAIEQESGMTLFDVHEGRDWGEVFTLQHPGLGNERYGVLTCATGGVGISMDIAAWTAIDDGTVSANFNGMGFQTLWFDFTGCVTIEEVRQVIQVGFRALWPNVEVSIQYDAANLPYWQITSGEIDGSTVSLLQAAGIGTDISSVTAGGEGLRGTLADGAAIDNNASYTAVSSPIGQLVCATARGFAYRPQTHWTHFPVYGTENSNDPVKNEELYSWLFDVPIMASFTVSQSAGNILACSNGKGLFRQYDIGSVVTFENGAISTIQYLCDAVGVRIYDPVSRYAIGTGGVIAEQSAQIGATHLMTITQAGNIVTRISGTRTFAVLDVRKPLFFADGSISNIIEYIDANHVKVLNSGVKTSQAVAIDPIVTGRTFADFITDEKIADRFLKFKVMTRFWESLPEIDMGTIAPGFLAVAVKDTSTVYYSPMTMGDFETRTYHTGYHNPSKQVDNKLKDKIQGLRTYPDSIVAYCSNSRWVTSTANPISDLQPDYGINNALLPNFVLNDNIGCNHINSIAEVDVGEDILITSEPGVRFANNTKYGPKNLAAGQISETIKQLSTRVRAHYNPFSGYIIWAALADSPIEKTQQAEELEATGGYGSTGYYGQYSYKGEGGTYLSLVSNKINKLTGVCLRYAITEDQGQGWCFYSNDSHWLWPEPLMKILTIYDGAEQPHFVVLDESTGLWWEIGTRQGPAGSGMVSVYEDKKTGNYAGAEIPCTVTRKEQTGPREHVKIRHMLGHIGMRPMFEKLQNVSGHTSRGYRNAFKVNYAIYRDGELMPLAETKDVPFPGDLTVDTMVEGHRLRERITTSASEWRLVELNPEYLLRDMKLSRSQGEMQEDVYDNELATDMLFWISRGSNPLLERISGEIATGSYFSRANGPDGMESAITLAAGDEISHSIDDIRGDFTIKIGVQGNPGFWLINVGDLELSISDSRELVYDDGQNYIRKQLEWKSGYLLLSVQRKDKDLLIFEQGVLKDTVPLNHKVVLSGNVEIDPNEIVDVFDVRVYNKAISEGAEFYYYENVTTKQGKAVLPLWV